MRHPVGSVDEFAPRTIQLREVGSRSVGIVNTGERLHAVLNICPHALAPVCEGRLTGTMLPSPPGQPIWGLDGRVLRCPWHGYEFDLEDGGRSVFTTFQARVRMFPVSVEDGVVSVELRERPATGRPDWRQRRRQVEAPG